jgi:hypothetical protein
MHTHARAPSLFLCPSPTALLPLPRCLSPALPPSYTTCACACLALATAGSSGSSERPGLSRTTTFRVGCSTWRLHGEEDTAASGCTTWLC